MTSLSRLSIAACLALAAGLAAVPASAQQQPQQQRPAGRPSGPPELTINVSGWQGGAFGRQDNHQFSHCGISRAFENGVTMMISMNPEFLVNIGLVNPRWTLTENQQSVARIEIDGGYERQFPAVAAGRNVLVIPTGNTPELIENLRRRNTLTITTGQGPLSFPLRGTSQSLERLRGCVETANRLARRAGQAAAPAAPAQPGGAAPAQPEAATPPAAAAAPEGTQPPAGQPREVRLSLEALTAILAAAGLPDVWLRLPTQIPANDMHLNYVWRTAGVVGGLHQEPRGEQVDIDGFSDRYTALFSGLCPDGFQRQFTDSEVIQRVYAVRTGTIECRQGERQEFVSFFFALDDYNYSAFFHQTALDNRAAAESATAAIARIVHDLASNAGHPPAEGTPEAGSAPPGGAAPEGGAAPAPAAPEGATPSREGDAAAPAPAPATPPAGESGGTPPAAGSGSGSN